MIKAPITVTLNTTTYVPVSIGSELEKTADKRDVSVYTADLSSFLIAVDASGTGEATIPTGNLGLSKESTEGVLLYAKAVGSAVDLHVIAGVMK